MRHRNAGRQFSRNTSHRKAMFRALTANLVAHERIETTDAKAKGINEKKTAKIFELIEYFAGYGFPKAHSTAYAFLAYQTAYLKANYPWHFACALLRASGRRARGRQAGHGAQKSRGEKRRSHESFVPQVSPERNPQHARAGWVH